MCLLSFYSSMIFHVECKSKCQKHLVSFSFSFDCKRILDFSHFFCIILHEFSVAFSFLDMTNIKGTWTLHSCRVTFIPNAMTQTWALRCIYKLVNREEAQGDKYLRACRAWKMYFLLKLFFLFWSLFKFIFISVSSKCQTSFEF